jgi:hypothetical protein
MESALIINVNAIQVTVELIVLKKFVPKIVRIMETALMVFVTVNLVLVENPVKKTIV